MKAFADVHVHMEQYAAEPATAMLDRIADCGVTSIALQALPKYSMAENLAVLYWKTRYRRMEIFAFGGLHQFDCFGDIPYEKQAERLLDLGFDGMKFLDMKPDFRKRLGKGLNDPSYDRMFSLLEERQVPVMIHSGDPESFWDRSQVTEYQIRRGWFYGDGTFLTSREIYEEVFAMLDRHPALQVTLAHFFFLSQQLDEAVRVMETYPNVRFDLTPGGEMYLGFSKNIDAWHDFFIQYRNRILFGKDSNTMKGETNASLNGFIRTALTHDRSLFTGKCYGDMTIRGLDLDEDTVQRICCGNFTDFVGKRRIVPDNAVPGEAERLYAVVRDNPALEKEKQFIEYVTQNLL